MRWCLSHRFDPRARALADRHYNRQKIGTPQFSPPGRIIVLLTEAGDALWVSIWQQFVRHRWQGAWVNSLFRNESAELSSELIIEAEQATRAIWGDPPAQGMITFIDTRVIPGFFRRGPGGRTLEWGYSYHEAGWTHEPDGWTQINGLYVLGRSPASAPPPALPQNSQISLFG